VLVPTATKPPHNSLPIAAAIGEDVSRAWRGPTVRIPAPVKFVPLTGGVRPSCRAQNAPLADKDEHTWHDSPRIGSIYLNYADNSTLWLRSELRLPRSCLSFPSIVPARVLPMM
jgi:hypothetical protein